MLPIGPDDGATDGARLAHRRRSAMTVTRFRRAFVAGSLCVLTGCEAITSSKSDCDKTALSEQFTSPITPKLVVRNLDPVAGRSFMTTTRALFTGTITKVYCSGKVSSTFDYNTTFTPGTMSTDEMSLGFWVGRPYQFNFDNELDYVQVIYKIRAYYTDKAFESLELSQKIYPRDLRLDVDIFQYYFALGFMGTQQWFEIKNSGK
jgi:hypothetical protein